jgi:curved DNA-binding protein CbpA
MRGRVGGRSRNWRADPFGALGLPPDRGLTDDDVRAAWRRIATATHPDRGDGGDPERFAAAAAAYTALRTPSGRGEALADLATARQPGRVGAGPTGPALLRFAARVRDGRRWRLALRALAVLAVSAAAIAADGSGPAAPALITGAVTWLVRTGRGDLAPPRDPGRPLRKRSYRQNDY